MQWDESDKFLKVLHTRKYALLISIFDYNAAKMFE